jgi:hypothetical protein
MCFFCFNWQVRRIKYQIGALNLISLGLLLMASRQTKVVAFARLAQIIQNVLLQLLLLNVRT